MEQFGTIVYSLTYLLFKKKPTRTLHVYLIFVCFLFEFKTSPYEMAPTRAERFDPSEDDEEDSSITSFEKGSPAKTLI